MYAAFALRVRIAILLARADYAAVTPLADRAIRAAEASGDDYVMVQVLNILGAVRFDCATSKLAQPHARSHLSSLDPHDALPHIAFTVPYNMSEQPAASLNWTFSRDGLPVGTACHHPLSLSGKSATGAPAVPVDGT